MARSFNGSSDEIQCGSVNTIALAVNSAGSVTLSVWVNASSLVTAIQGLIGYDNAASSFATFYVNSSGKMSYYVSDPTFGLLNVDPGTNAISTGSWHHVAMTYTSGGAVSGFLDGAADGTSGTGAGMRAGSNGTFRFGNEGFAGRNFNGKLADGAVWTTVLTAGEIAALAKGVRPYTVRQKSLYGYWPLDGIQSPEPDLTGNANNGTLTGTAPASGPPIALFTPRWPIMLDTGPTTNIYNVNYLHSIQRKFEPIGV